MFQNYSYPSRIIAGLARDVILLRSRAFREDARVCMQSLGESFQVHGWENIPQQGPCAIAVNHYYRPGFNAPWIAFAVAASVPVEVHWIMTGELTFPDRWFAPFGRVLSRYVLHRIARVYGFTSMPPMPPRAKDAEERAASVRTVLHVVKNDPDVILGFAPEGSDSVDGTLAKPAPGLGRFGLLLSAAGLKIVPAGVYESDGRFWIRFGGAYDLSVPPGLSSDEKDHHAALTIMKNIAALLPADLRGDFA